MKTIAKMIGIATLGCIIPVTAQTRDTDKKKPDSTGSTSGGTSGTSTDRSSGSSTGDSATDRSSGTTTDRDRTTGDRTGGTTTDRDRTTGDRTGGTAADRDRDRDRTSTDRTTEERETRTEREGGTTTTETTKTTFTPDAKNKVVKYFETYKSKPHGLPPEWATKIKVKEVPAAWRTSRISPGVVVSEQQRTYLVEAPPELTELLPEPAAEVHYYIAGSNVVAIDRNFRVVDSIQIPSIKFTND